MLVQGGRELLFVKEKGKHISGGKNTGDGVKNPFAAGPGKKPMMDDRYP